MTIDLSNVQFVGHVDQLLSANKKEIELIEFDIYVQTRAEKVSSDREVTRQESIIAAQSRVDALTAALALLTPDTPKYTSKQLELISAQAQLAVLQDRALNSGVLADVNWDLELAYLEARLQVSQDYETQLTDHKAALEAGTP